MRLWPFKREARQREAKAGARRCLHFSRACTDTRSGFCAGSPDPGATAALEFCAGTWARAFASADIKPSFPTQITPTMLACIGRELVRAGEVLFAIDVRRGQISLCSPVGSWDVRGGPGSGFIGSTERGRHTGLQVRGLGYCLALRFCISVMGLIRRVHGPGYLRLDYAYLTGSSSWFGLELRLSQEAQARVGYLLPIPSDGGGGGRR